MTTICLHQKNDPLTCKVCIRLAKRGFVQGKIEFRPFFPRRHPTFIDKYYAKEHDTN